MPAVRRYSVLPGPSPNAFQDEYEDEITTMAVNGEAPRLTPINVSELNNTFSKMKCDTAPGLDGWTVTDPKTLPKSCLHLLSIILNEVE